jgi:hypothetical protein
MPFPPEPSTVGLDVLDERLFVQVETDERRHVGVDELVVGDAVADPVRDDDVAGARTVHQSRDADDGVREELQRIEPLVVHAAVDHVDRSFAVRGAHVRVVRSTEQVSALDEFDAHHAREQHVFEVGGVVHAGAEHDDDRVADVRWRRFAQRREEVRRIRVDRMHAMVREQ